MTAGGSAAFVGTPAEVALIRSVFVKKLSSSEIERFKYIFVKHVMDPCSCLRMTSDGSLPADKRRNYSSVFNAIARIYKVCIIAYINKTFHCNMCSTVHPKLTRNLQEEGLTTLWRGATPTMAR